MPDVNILINATDKASGPLKSVGGEVDNLNNKAKNAASSGLASLAGALGTAIAVGAATGVVALVGLGGAVAVTGIAFDNMKEQAQIAFTTMLGSGAQAKAFLDDLQKFAAKTPFEFPELVSASQRMLAMGFAAEDVLPTLTAIGDAVAGLGGSSEMVGRVTTALGQMQAKGKASGEEMMQLTEAGIPAWKFLADAIGTNVAGAMKAVTAGTVSADVAIGALVAGMNAKFGGLMEAQSKTFGGMLSTIKDTFSQVSGQVMQPLFEQLTRGLAMVVSWTSSPAFTSGVAALVGWMEKAGVAAERFFDHISAGLSPIDALSNAFALVLPDSLFAIWWRFTEILKGTTRFVQSLFGEVKRFEDDSPMMGYLLDLGDRVREVFGYFVDWLGRAAKATWDYAQRVLPPFIEVLVKVWDGLVFGADMIGKFIASLAKTFMPVSAAIAKFGGFEDILNAVVAVLGYFVLTAIPPLIAGLVSFLAPIAGVIAAVTALRWAWENDFGRIRSYTQETVKRISDWFFKESGIWKGTWEETVEYITWYVERGWKIDLFNATVGNWANIREKLKFHWRIMRDTLIAWTNETIQDIVGWKDRTVHAFFELGRNISDAWRDWTGPTVHDLEVWAVVTQSRIKHWIDWGIKYFNDFKTDAVAVFDAVLGWWDDNIQPWLDAGRDVIQGLWDGIRDKWTDLSSWFSGVWGDLSDRFKRFFGIASPSTVFYGYGKNLMEGLGEGIRAYASVPISYMESVSNSLTSQMDRLKGAVVQNVFDLKNAVKQFNLDPATVPVSWGGTLQPGQGINNLPIHTNPTAITPVVSTTPISTIGSAVGGNLATTGSSQNLLGGISVGSANIQGAVDSAAASANKVKDFIAGLGDFLMATVDNRTMSRVFQTLDANLTGINDLRAADASIGQTMASILGVDTLYGRLTDSVQLVMDKITAGTDINKVKELLQSAVTFRELANFHSTTDYANVLPTDTRLTGGTASAPGTVNNFNINLASGASASDDLRSTFNLLNSLYGTAPA